VSGCIEFRIQSIKEIEMSHCFVSHAIKRWGKHCHFIVKLNDRMKVLEIDMENMKIHIQADLEKLKTELHKIKHGVGEEIKKEVGEEIKLDLEEQKSSFADVLAKHVDTRLGTVLTELEDVQKNVSETKKK
jgi:hypothetical protein